ncbi:hypothetical protein [Paenibacillus sp. sgz302251]|uniref:hypothetical protein n=1 Tax=Paenibacillus sp. sgz302251 TaxID=3414493 RepID=UPI003C7B5502
MLLQVSGRVQQQSGNRIVRNELIASRLKTDFRKHLSHNLLNSQLLLPRQTDNMALVLE